MHSARAHPERAPRSLLFVADDANNRVMIYATPVSNDKAAANEFGQPAARPSRAAGHATSVSGLYHPTDVAVDSTNQKLYVVGLTTMLQREPGSFVHLTCK